MGNIGITVLHAKLSIMKTPSPPQRLYAQKMIKKGFQFVTVGSDQRFMSGAPKKQSTNLKILSQMTVRLINKQILK